MEATRILLGNLPDSVSLAVIEAARERDDVKIISGISETKLSGISAINDVSLEGIKRFQYRNLDFSFETIGRFGQFHDIDVFVNVTTDSPHHHHLATMVTLAVMHGEPLVVYTPELVVSQLVELKYHTLAIPIFYDERLHTIGSYGLPRIILDVAKVMTKKPVKQNGGFYTLDQLRDDLKP